MHRAAAPTKNDPAQNVNSTKVEKTCCNQIDYLLLIVFMYSRPTFQTSPALQGQEPSLE